MIEMNTYEHDAEAKLDLLLKSETPFSSWFKINNKWVNHANLGTGANGELERWIDGVKLELTEQDDGKEL